MEENSGGCVREDGGEQWRVCEGRWRVVGNSDIWCDHHIVQFIFIPHTSITSIGHLLGTRRDFFKNSVQVNALIKSPPERSAEDWSFTSTSRRGVY